MGREGTARTWRDAVTPLTVGLAFAILEILVMVLIRNYLTARFGLPF
jgi:hypothetical protein